MGQLVCARFLWPGDQRGWILAGRERERGPQKTQEVGTGKDGGGTSQRRSFWACWGSPGAARTAQEAEAKSQRGTRRHQVGEWRCCMKRQIHKTGCRVEHDASWARPIAA